MSRGIIPITVGGDHSITTPILRAIGGLHSRHKGPIGMIHFDAHADIYIAAAGTQHHAGAAFRLAVEEGLIDPARTIDRSAWPDCFPRAGYLFRRAFYGDHPR